jgi:hypothetical protein
MGVDMAVTNDMLINIADIKLINAFDRECLHLDKLRDFKIDSDFICVKYNWCVMNKLRIIKYFYRTKSKTKQA